MNNYSFGAHCIIGLSGTKLSDIDKKILSELHPAGILLLKRNFLQNAPYDLWLEELSSLLDSVYAYAERDKMIISIDHEGGRVHRTPPPITQFPETIYYAQNAFEVGEAMGIELASIGVNVSWSPVADINSNQNNPVIGTRSFGAEPEEVAHAVVQFLAGIESTPLKGCIKHFPGHGDTQKDSHHDLPCVDLSCEDLQKRELIPFEAAIAAGVSLVMTSHVMYPALDSAWPATLSEKILSGTLRNDLGFTGCVVTDDLDMKAISDRFSATEVVAHACNAGCDFFIIARYPDGSSDKPLVLAESFRDAYDNGLINHARLEASKVLTKDFLQNLPKLTPRHLEDSIFQKHAKLVEQIGAVNNEQKGLNAVEDR